MRAQVALDREHRTITAPAGMRIDFGGIGKGYAVDVAAEKLAALYQRAIDKRANIREATARVR